MSETTVSLTLDSNNTLRIGHGCVCPALSECATVRSGGDLPRVDTGQRNHRARNRWPIIGFSRCNVQHSRPVQSTPNSDSAALESGILFWLGELHRPNHISEAADSQNLQDLPVVQRPAVDGLLEVVWMSISTSNLNSEIECVDWIATPDN